MTNSQNFLIMDKLLENYKTNIVKQKCCHNDTITKDNIIVCIDCGECLKTIITHDREWSFYGNSDNKKLSDPNRVQIRKSEDKSINKDVKNMGFPSEIINKAYKIYLDGSNGKICRGVSRKGLIFASIYHAYNNSENPQTPESLIDIFGITKKEALKGLKDLKINSSNTSSIHNSFTSIENHISTVMEQFSSTTEQLENVIGIYRSIKNKSSELNRSKPHSLAVSVIYFWIKQNNIKMDLTKFSKKTNLSENTINRNIKEIKRVIKLIS